MGLIESGRGRRGALRTGSAHDGLVFAVALARGKAGGQLFPLFGPAPVPLITPELRR